MDRRRREHLREGRRGPPPPRDSCARWKRKREQWGTRPSDAVLRVVDVASISSCTRAARPAVLAWIRVCLMRGAGGWWTLLDRITGAHTGHRGRAEWERGFFFTRGVGEVWVDAIGPGV